MNVIRRRSLLGICILFQFLVLIYVWHLDKLTPRIIEITGCQP